MAFDREGRRIVSGSRDNTVRVWDAATGACLEVIEGFGDVAAIAERERLPLAGLAGAERP